MVERARHRRRTWRARRAADCENGRSGGPGRPFGSWVRGQDLNRDLQVMSLTSYRAAPPRDKAVWNRELERKGAEENSCVHPSVDLAASYSPAPKTKYHRPEGLNDRVRNGIGWGPSDKATRSTRRMKWEKTSCLAS